MRPVVYFRDEFTDADGTSLDAHAPTGPNPLGLTATVVTGPFTVSGNQATHAVAGNAAVWWDVGAADVTLSCDYTQGGGIGGLALRFQDISNYWLILANAASGGTVTIQSVIAGSFVIRATGRIPWNNGVTRRLQATAVGNLIVVTADGVELCRYASASTGNTRTKHGLSIGSGAAVGQLWDNLQIGAPVSTVYPFGQITVTKPSRFQVYQRDGADLADLALTGTYFGDASAGMEARWNGGAWTGLTAANGAFSGTLAAQPAGQGLLEVRFVGYPQDSRVVPFVGIGDVFLVAGQSNAEGRIATLQSYSHPTLRAGLYNQGGAWVELADPTDTDNPTLGSVWPLVATYVMAQTGFPVAFVCGATGGTALSVANFQWYKAHAGGGAHTAYDTFVALVLASKVNGARACLWWQGESDSVDTVNVTLAGYQAALTLLRSNLATDLSIANMKMVVCMLAQFVSTSTRASLDAVRGALRTANGADALILNGPELYDLPASDGQHLTTLALAQVAALRWWHLIHYHLLGGTVGRGPILSSVAQVDSTHIDVAWQVNTPPLLPASPPTAGWLVTDGTGTLTVTGAARQSASVIRLTVNRALTAGTVNVSWASFNDAVSVVLTDSDPDALPAEPFYSAQFTAV